MLADIAGNDLEAKAAANSRNQIYYINPIRSAVSSGGTYE